MQHVLPVRVYYEDTDAGGVVYHANFLKFAERGRTELLRSLGFTNTSLVEKEGFLFVVRHIEADYRKPGRLEEDLEVVSVVEEIKNASFVMRQTVSRGSDILCVMKVALVCVEMNKTDIKPVRIPDHLKSGFETYMTTPNTGSK